MNLEHLNKTKIAIFMIAVVVELLALYYLVTKQSSWPFLTAHFVSSLFILELFRTSTDHYRNLWKVSFAFWASVPILGMLTLLVFFLILPKVADPIVETLSVDSMIEEEEASFNELATATLEEQAVQESGLISKRIVSVQPLVNIINSGSSEEKRKAIQKLRKIKDNESISILKSALQQPSYEVRYLATIALKLIEQDFTEDIRDLVIANERDPNNFELRDELTYASMRFFQSNIVSSRIGQIYLKKALENAEISLQIDASKAISILQIAKINLFMGNFDKANEYIDQLLEKYPGKAEYLFWKAEIAYYMQNYSELKNTCNEIAKEFERYPRFHEHLDYWGKYGS